MLIRRWTPTNRLKSLLKHRGHGRHGLETCAHYQAGWTETQAETEIMGKPWGVYVVWPCGVDGACVTMAYVCVCTCFFLTFIHSAHVELSSCIRTGTGTVRHTLVRVESDGSVRHGDSETSYASLGDLVKHLVRVSRALPGPAL